MSLHHFLPIGIPIDGIKELNRMARKEDSERDVIEIIEKLKSLNR